MHLLTLTTALLATLLSTTSATPIESRQEVGHIRATFYNLDGGCQGKWAEDFAFVENVPFDTCIDMTVGPFTSTFFNESSITKTFQFFNKHCNIPESERNSFQLGAKDSPHQGDKPGCRAGPILSYIIRDKTKPLL